MNKTLMGLIFLSKIFLKLFKKMPIGLVKGLVEIHIPITLAEHQKFSITHNQFSQFFIYLPSVCPP